MQVKERKESRISHFLTKATMWAVSPSPGFESRLYHLDTPLSSSKSGLFPCKGYRCPPRRAASRPNETVFVKHDTCTPHAKHKGWLLGALSEWGLSSVFNGAELWLCRCQWSISETGKKWQHSAEKCGKKDSFSGAQGGGGSVG